MNDLEIMLSLFGSVLVVAYFTQYLLETVNEPHKRNENGIKPRVTINGEIVRSYGEKQIADFLSEIGIAYAYEPRNFVKAGLLPDFYLGEFQGKITVIEYWGLINHPQKGRNYRQLMKKKLKIYDRLGFRVISLFPPQMRDGSFRQIIEDSFAAAFLR